MKKNKIKKRMKKIFLSAVISCFPFIFMACSVMTIASVAIGFLGSTTVDENLTESENENMMQELKDKTEWINSYSTYDDRDNRIGALSDYYGTDLRFKQGWEYTLAYLKYSQINSSNSDVNSINAVKQNIDKAVRDLAPKFIYKKDKITTTREYKEIEYSFDVASGITIPDSIKVYSSKPTNFSAANYKIDTNIYINDENKTYKVDNGSKNKITVQNDLPQQINNILVYKTKPDEFYVDNYKYGQQIYIIDENTTYRIDSVEFRGYIYYYFEKTTGTPKQFNLYIYTKESDMYDPSAYKVNDYIYIKNRDRTYKVESVGINVFTTNSGKPNELKNIITLSYKPTNFDRKNYKTGDIIYIINENNTYKAIEKEVTKKETKDDIRYFITSIKNIQGSYSISYKQNTDVLKKENETITVTKPIIEGISQVDSPYANLKNIIGSKYPDEDLNKAAEGIVSMAYTYVDKDMEDTDVFYTGVGNFAGAGEAFNGGAIDFISKVAPGAIKSKEKYNILPSITIAQAMLESGYGKSGLTAKANNLFGIKAFSSWTGPYVEMLTKEYDSSGGSFFVTARFRAYNTWDDSIEDHSKVLMQNNFTAVRNAKNYIEAANALRAGGYATDPNYPNLVISYIQRYNLQQYDTPILADAGK